MVSQRRLPPHYSCTSVYLFSIKLPPPVCIFKFVTLPTGDSRFTDSRAARWDWYIPAGLHGDVAQGRAYALCWLEKQTDWRDLIIKQHLEVDLVIRRLEQCYGLRYNEMFSFAFTTAITSCRRLIAPSHHHVSLKRGRHSGVDVKCKVVDFAQVSVGLEVCPWIYHAGMIINLLLSKNLYRNGQENWI
jgi:hypothetical protein